MLRGTQRFPAHAGLGAPVAANRGASGIDGVLSTAAGWAEGLGRGATLVVGDVSFLHDVNGLNLLRTAELRPPLTVRRSLRSCHCHCNLQIQGSFPD